MAETNSEPETLEQEERWRQIALLNILGQTHADIRKSHSSQNLPVPTRNEIQAAIRWGIKNSSSEFLSNKEHRTLVFDALKFQEKMAWEEFRRLQDEQANGGLIQTCHRYDETGNLRSHIIVRKDAGPSILKALNHILSVTRTVAQLRGLEAMIETHDSLDEIAITGDFEFYNAPDAAPIVENNYAQIEDAKSGRDTA
jgi:hypothetical protein